MKHGKTGRKVTDKCPPLCAEDMSIFTHAVICIRQFGIILEQCYLFVVLNTISFDCLRFVVKEAICTDSRNEVHQEIVNGSVS